MVIQVERPSFYTKSCKFDVENYSGATNQSTMHGTTYGNTSSTAAAASETATGIQTLDGDTTAGN